MTIHTAEELREELEEKKARLLELEEGRNTEEYDEMLDESGPVIVAGLSYMPSHILKNVDETAYRCGLNDFNDGMITELNDEIEALEEELNEAEEEEKDGE